MGLDAKLRGRGADNSDESLEDMGKCRQRKFLWVDGAEKRETSVVGRMRFLTKSISNLEETIEKLANDARSRS